MSRACFGPVTFLLAALTAGCVSLPAVTSGQIGCAQEDIVISNEDEGWSTKTWTAECHGKRFYCSGMAGGKYSAAQVSCKPEQETAAAAPPPPQPARATGCAFDEQCKGARICRQGQCVDP